MSKTTRGVIAFLLLLAATGPVLSPSATALAQQGPTNLLVNGDFEAWDWNNPGWPFQDGIPEVQVCPGWRAFYLDSPPDSATAPEYWKRPEFRDVKAAEFAYRVHSGMLAQKYFTFGGQHLAGLYQQVPGIVPGTPLQFSIYMETWGCMTDGGDWNVCPTGEKSNNPSPMHTRVGIDPYGGTSPWSPNVVWSPETEAYDHWTLFQVDAVAQSDTVTVFTYSYADWFDYVFRMANDVYVDDGSLIALNDVPAPTATEEPTAEPPTATVDVSQAAATPTPTETPSATPTPRPDGATVYVVQDGDTLGAIAAQYNLTVDELLQLNSIEDPNVVEVGQELVLAVPAATATPPPPAPTLAQPTATQELSTEPTAQPTPTSVPTVRVTPTIAPASLTVTATPTPAPTPAAHWPIGVLVLGLVVGVAGGLAIGRHTRQR